MLITEFVYAACKCELEEVDGSVGVYLYSNLREMETWLCISVADGGTLKWPNCWWTSMQTLIAKM